MAKGLLERQKLTNEKVNYYTCVLPNNLNQSIIKSRPNVRSISTQHIPTLLGATCCVRLATVLRGVATCCELKIELVRMPWCNIVAGTWPSDYNIMQHPQTLREKYFEPTTSNMSQHIAPRRNVAANRTQHVAPSNVSICCVAMLRSFGRGLRVKCH